MCTQSIGKTCRAQVTCGIIGPTGFTITVVSYSGKYWRKRPALTLFTKTVESVVISRTVYAPGNIGAIAVVRACYARGIGIRQRETDENGFGWRPEGSRFLDERVAESGHNRAKNDTDSKLL